MTSRTIAIGDIHGCVHALDALLEGIQPRHDDLLIVLGDFIDQGRDTRDVIDRLIDLRDECHLVCLLGNHDEMMLEALGSEAARAYWEDAGGAATVFSYRYGGSLSDIPPEHIHFVQACRDYFETDDFIFVHATCVPELPLATQPPHALRWAMLDATDVQRHMSGKTVVCGHSEQASGEILDLGAIRCIDTACWHYGWLTALDVATGHCWQASRFGVLRSEQENAVGPIGRRVS